jgi:hypothetical protein
MVSSYVHRVFCHTQPDDGPSRVSYVHVAYRLPSAPVHPRIYFQCPALHPVLTQTNPICTHTPICYVLSYCWFRWTSLFFVLGPFHWLCKTSCVNISQYAIFTVKSDYLLGQTRDWKPPLAVNPRHYAIQSSLLEWRISAANWIQYSASDWQPTQTVLDIKDAAGIWTMYLLHAT